MSYPRNQPRICALKTGSTPVPFRPPVAYISLQFLARICPSARQRRHINDELVFHFISQHPLIGLVDRLHVDDFHIGRNTVLAAEIEHFLGLWQPADH